MHCIDQTYKVEKRISEIKISPRDICGFYQPRDMCIVAMKECWYCRYADFQLGKLEPLEVGTCLYQGEEKGLERRVYSVKDAY